MLSKIAKTVWLRALTINLWLIALLALVYAARKLHHQHQLDWAVAPAEKEMQVPARLIYSVIRQESRFKIDAIGQAGEVGLMQIMPEPFREWRQAVGRPELLHADLKNPALNVQCGTWLLKRGLDNWNGQVDPLPLALAQYNAGRANALRWNEISLRTHDPLLGCIDYPVTSNYVATILTEYRGKRK